jgi:hypothetical protein
MQIRKNPTIFWGYSFDDAATLEAIISHARTSGPLSEAWILVHPSSKDVGTIDYFRALNLQIIIGDTKNMLDFLGKEINEIELPPSYTKRRKTSDLFPDYFIPMPSQVPSRPIVEFFRGSPPTWSDIFSGILYRTSRYSGIRDLIFSGRRNVIITGVPVSGKTTLLMQLAVEVDYNGHKLMMDGATAAEAQLILRRLGGDRALIFIDNVVNDIEAVIVFNSNPNITVVGADRGHTFSTVTDKLAKVHPNLIDVSGLTDADLQGCRDSIPESIRKETYVYPEVAEGVQPSLYEFVHANTTELTVQERFEAALRTLRGDSPKLAEMLLFVAYVHSCRTPVSMDMAIGYWDRRIPSYNDIYQMITDVGALLTEYGGDLATEPQDYFSARSALAAESILNAAGSSFLKRMLLSFHENLSPFRICHYNIFKRWAYDYRLFTKAFSSWEEGRDFYERLYEKVESPYIRQHEALFLNERKRYKEAFKAIDLAIAEAGDQNFTIKNSHAIILFRANIDLAEKPGVRTQLDKGLNILMNCYKSDRRKGFHALTFAHHAIQYHKVFRDDIAINYLEYASRWLAEQKEMEPWLVALDRLQKIVNKRLTIS